MSAAGAAFAQTTQESEPNDNAATADVAPKGGKATGTFEWGQVEDHDYWSITVAAGETIFADVDVNEFGISSDPTLILYDTDGTTILLVDDAFDGLDPQIIYRATKAGTYFVRLSSSYQGFPGPKPYTLNFFEVKCPVNRDDTEPNDTRATASRLALGAPTKGTNCPADEGPIGNVDFYRVDVPAGVNLEIQADTTGRVKPQFGCACEIWVYMQLYGPDGATLATFNSEHDGSPYRLQYKTTTAGTYYVSINMWPGGIRYEYTLRARVMGRGKGDPVTARAEGLGMTTAVVADPFGDFIVTDLGGNQVWWVTADGRKEVITRAVTRPNGLAYDAFGNLLIVSQSGGVFKLAPNGNVSQFLVEDELYSAALAPDGSLWFTDLQPTALRHYDALGKLIETINLTVYPFDIRVSPAGTVFYSTVNSTDGTTIFKLVGNQSQQVLHAPVFSSGFALDAAGSIYVTGRDNRVYVYNASGTLVEDPFASELTQPTGITFGRNADGTMNRRIFVTQEDGRLVELNSTTVSQPGAAVGFATQTQVVSDLLKPGPLTEPQRRFLDGIGNKNGRYDVGDLRAFLIFGSTVAASTFPRFGGTP